MEMFEQNARILFQGDSITDYGRERNVNADSPANRGLGSSHAMLIAARLLAEYPERNLQFYNRGFCGDTILHLAARWKTDTLDLRPDYLSILIGANDVWGHFRKDGGVDLPRYESVYRELLDRTLKCNPEVRFILCEPFLSFFEGAVTSEAWRNDMDAFRAAVRKIAKEYHAIFVPFQSAFEKANRKAPPQVWSFDGVHPLHAGYGIMTRTWIETVRRALRKNKENKP